MRMAATIIIAAMSAAIVACGGGGGDSYDAGTGMVEEHYTLARFEFERGSCAFDNEEARKLAALQYPAEFAQCGLSWINHTIDGQKWPALSWPSTPRLS